MSSPQPATAELSRGESSVSQKKSRRAVWIAGALGLLLLVIGVVPRISRSNRASSVAEGAATGLPDVAIVKARLAAGSSELELPGNTEPINVASISARTSGYLRERTVDIGSSVRAGQLLAVISSPEVDQELAQGRASLEQSRAALEQATANLAQSEAQVNQAQAMIGQAQANEEIAARTNERWARLVKNGVLPKQQGDERRSAYDARIAESKAAVAAESTAQANVGSRRADILAARATVQAQQANVRRLEEMQSFERIVAPFDGIVTERHVEKGDLITAGSGGSDRNLFSVAQGKTLRIQVSVPQAYAIDLQKGQQAAVLIRERPGETFTGTVARTAGSITASSRTLLTEVQVDNRLGRLLPGMYAQVKFSLTRSRPVVLVPGSALLVNSQGTRVVQVMTNDRVHLIPVQVGRDLGPEVEILSGLSGAERLANNPSDTLSEGQQVKAESKK